MPPRKVDPKVQSIYDAFTDEERVEFDERLAKAGRRLSDMRIAKSTGKLDERLLIPKAKQSANFNWHKKLNDKIMRGEELTPDERLKMFGPSVIPEVKRSTELPKGKDIAGYIQDSLGGGRALADFYLHILDMDMVDARRAGVFMNHKLQAAAWLADRGWGKVAGDMGGEKGITINLVNHAEVNTPERPPISAAAIESRPDNDNDAGRDVDVTVEFSSTDETKPRTIEVEDDDFIRGEIDVR
jgi:hypothetical protein